MFRALLIVPAIALGIALTGCTTSGTPEDPADETTAEETTEETTGGDTLADCVVGSWSADIDDMASQLYDMYADIGIAASNVTGTGSQTLHWASDGLATLETNYVFVVVVPLPNDGPEMVMTQQHQGDVTGYLDIEGETAVPSDWDSSAYVVNTTLTMNGEPFESGAVPEPEAGFSQASPMSVTCSGDSMTTFPEGAFITQNWSRQTG